MAQLPGQMTVEAAVRLLEQYEAAPSGSMAELLGVKGKDAFNSNSVWMASRILNNYAMEGGDVSGIPQSIQKYTTPQYAQHIASQRAESDPGKTFGDQLFSFIKSPPVLIAAGGAAAMAGGAGAAAGAGSEAGAGAGLSAELAAGAPELAGTMGLEAGAATGGATLADASWGVNPASTGTTLADTIAAPAGGAAGGTGITPGVVSEGVMGGGALGSGLSTGGGTAAGTASTTAGLGTMATNLGGALLEYMGQRKAGKTAEGLMQQQIDSDLWRKQQPRYFEPFYEAATKGIGGTPYGEAIASDTSRKMASMGYNMSGNQMAEIAKSLNLGTTDYLRALTPAATGRGESQAPGQFAPALIGAAKAPYQMAGYGLGEIVRNAPAIYKGMQSLFL